MRIKFLGTGSAFVTGNENYHSNIVISKDDKHLLYDAGTTIPDALDAVDMTPQDLDSLYISHLHADHAGGVEYLAFKTYFEQFPFGVDKINLYGHHTILEEGWDHTWQGGLKSIQGQTNTLETYFDTTYMSSNDSFDFAGINMMPIQTVHVVDDRRFVPSYGLMFTEDDFTVFITGDSQFAPNQMLTFYDQADMIFHDCEFAEYPGSVHAQFHQLCSLPPETKSKMWLYHYMLKDKSVGDLHQLALENGFAGLVVRGQEFSFGEDRQNYLENYVGSD